jgi:hypothetical protein
VVENSTHARLKPKLGQSLEFIIWDTNPFTPTFRAGRQ